MKKLLFLLGLLALPALAAPTITSSYWDFTDASGAQIPFLFGKSSLSNQYELLFPPSVTVAQQNEVIALPQFNNYPISGVNPTVTVGPLFPPGPGSPTNYISSDVAENANFAVTAANYAVMFQVTTGAANVTATLPAAATLSDGWYCFLRKADTGTGFVVNNQLSDAVAVQGNVTLYWTDGANWYNEAYYGDWNTSGNLTLYAPGATTFPKNGVGTTPTDAVILSNTTAAAVGSQQISPFSLHFVGQGWKTNAVAASEQVDVIANLTPVQGAVSPTTSWTIYHQVNGSGYIPTFTQTYNGTAGNPSISTTIGDGGANGYITFSNVSGAMVVGSGGTVEFSNIIAPSSSGGQNLGTTGLPWGNLFLNGAAGGNAAAGSVGEVGSTTVASGAAVSLTSTMTVNATSVALTAGDWDVWYEGTRALAASTSITQLITSISTTTGTLSSATAGDGSYVILNVAAEVPGGNVCQNVGPVRISVAVTTTVYAVVSDTFSISTDAAFGIIRARRVR